MDYDIMYSGTWVPMFRRNMLLPSSTIKMETAFSFEILVTTYKMTISLQYSFSSTPKSEQLMQQCCAVSNCDVLFPSNGLSKSIKHGFTGVKKDDRCKILKCHFDLRCFL
jgi:hypothetical protein